MKIAAFLVSMVLAEGSMDGGDHGMMGGMEGGNVGHSDMDVGVLNFVRRTDNDGNSI